MVHYVPILERVSNARFQSIYKQKRFFFFCKINRGWFGRKIIDPEVKASDHLIIFIIGIVFASVQIIVAKYLGPQLPCLLSGLACMIVQILFMKFSDIRTRTWPHGSIGQRVYFIPFIIIIVILILVQGVPTINQYFIGGNNKLAQAILDPSPGLGGYSTVDFPWLTHAGVIVTFVSLLTPLIVGFYQPDAELELHYPGEISRDAFVEHFHHIQVNYELSFSKAIPDLKKKKFCHTQQKQLMNKAVSKYKSLSKRSKKIGQIYKEAFLEAFREVRGLFISVTSFAAMSTLMGNFSMTQTLAQGIVSGLQNLPVIYAMIIPIIGALGRFVIGFFFFSRKQKKEYSDF